MSPQVLAYSLGLGTLVQDEKKLALHMKAELDHNDSPYGLLVMTGMNQMCTLLYSGVVSFPDPAQEGLGTSDGLH